MKGL
jgi:hypothetical protein